MSDDTNPEQVWHYTSVDGLIGIVQNHRLWATSASCMNDINEMRTFAKSLSDALGRIRSSLSPEELRVGSKLVAMYTNDVDDLYLLSGSREGDLLTLWRSYGLRNGPAYAIHLDPTQALGPCERSGTGGLESSSPSREETMQTEDPDHTQIMSTGWTHVVYVPRTGEQHEEFLREEIGKHSNSRHPTDFIVIRQVVNDRTARTKDAAFEDEREVRFIAAVGPSRNFVKHRNGPYGLTPYIELGRGANAHGYVPAGVVESLPITEIKIGPSPAGGAHDVRILRQLLDDHGYHTTKISVSDIPYR